MTKQRIDINDKNSGNTIEFKEWLENALIEDAKILDELAKSDENYTPKTKLHSKKI